MRPTRETFKSRCSRLLQDNAAHLKLLRNNLEKYLSELTLDFIYFGKFSAIKNCKFQPFQPLYPLAQNYSEHWGLTLFNHHHTTSHPSQLTKRGILFCTAILIPLSSHPNCQPFGSYLVQPSSYLCTAVLTDYHVVIPLHSHPHTSL